MVLKVVRKWCGYETTKRTPVLVEGSSHTNVAMGISFVNVLTVKNCIGRAQ
jgi:hypothetical protein